ncbi:hypothetical protein [Bacillus methanolicus]|uniref:Uncharacterized protein n=1 Tax=Bacillus methanolicus (strain MGA3 / ATCC 53907) TaxID=796606 RepID=I3EBC1_BACMM|nr:hypothetical protein [Bacillus methanolicus]AIE61472.1 hypothetical protein BMMGA3_15595 [Bacillus methanolicus MGA3]EIJ83792.1 hypothetical protein MGA3_00795 [Bacillus methanolicus MGA3]
MRRPIIHTNVNQKVDLSVTPSQVSRTTVELTGLALEKRLRQKRSEAYVNAITKLDAGGVTCSHAQIEELKQAIQSEFPELTPYQYPIGIIAKCYLGNPYEVHTLDVKLDIVQHYKRGEALPPQMDRARSIALHPGYAFIEVYSDTLRAVTKNGDVAVIQG